MHTHPNVEGFKLTVKINYQIAKYLSSKSTWKLSIRNGLKTFHSNLGCFSLSLCISNNYNYCISFPNGNCISLHCNSETAQ